MVFGEVVDVESDEKREAVMLFLKKYSSDYLKEGMEYIDKLYERVVVLKLKIDAMSGKSRKAWTTLSQRNSCLKDK